MCVCVCVCVARSQPQRPLGEEDEAEEAEGLFPGRPGQAGAEGHERRGAGEEEPGGTKMEEDYFFLNSKTQQSCSAPE